MKELGAEYRKHHGSITHELDPGKNMLDGCYASCLKQAHKVSLMSRKKRPPTSMIRRLGRAATGIRPATEGKYLVGMQSAWSADPWKHCEFSSSLLNSIVTSTVNLRVADCRLPYRGMLSIVTLGEKAAPQKP